MKAYLTIDDSPSERFRELVDFLHERNIPAVLFCRGDLLEQNPEDGVYAIHKGFVLGNHGYAHKRASRFESFDEVARDIAHADSVIEGVYKMAHTERPGKYFRFAYLDRGMGACLAEPGNLSEEFRTEHEMLLKSGLGHVPQIPTREQIEIKRNLQIFLRDDGFTPLPVEGITLPWYAQTEMAQAVDALCTFSLSDWALTDRHVGQHGFDTVQDLKDQIDHHPALQDETSRHIILAHDQAEIMDVTLELIAYMQEKGFAFLPVESRAQQRASAKPVLSSR